MKTLFPLPEPKKAEKTKFRCKHCEHMYKHQYGKMFYCKKQKGINTAYGHKKIKANDSICLMFEKKGKSNPCFKCDANCCVGFNLDDIPPLHLLVIEKYRLRDNALEHEDPRFEGAKCVFLRDNNLCNIEVNRPELKPVVCRDFYCDKFEQH